MKRIFTILGIVALAVAGLQAKNVDMSKVKFTGFSQEFLQKAARLEADPKAYAETTPESEIVMRKSWKQGNNTYEATLWGLGTLAESVGLEGQNGPLEHEDIPFFAVALVIQGYTNGMTIKESHTAVLAYCSWPTYQTLYSADTDESKSTSLVTISDFVGGDNCKKFQWNNFTYDDGNYSVYNFLPAVNQQNEIAAFPIWSPLFSDLTSTYNGTPGLTIVNSGEKSAFTIEAYDEEEKTMKFPFDFYFSNGTTFSGIYNGEADFVDMEVGERKFDFADLHVFNAGVADYNDANSDYIWPFKVLQGIEAEDWGKVNRFYFMGVENCKLYLDTSKSLEFSYDKLLLDYADGRTDLDDANVMRGAWFCPQSMTKPQDYQWQLVQPIMTDVSALGAVYQGYIAPLINPLPGIMVPAGYDTEIDNLWSKSDGVYGYYKGIYCCPTELKMSIGSTKGLDGEGTDMMTNTYNLNYNKKAVYHYNFKNMNDTEELTIVGDYVPVYPKIDPLSVQTVVADGVEISVKAINGEIVVLAAQDANVAIYSLDGACVANVKAIAGEAVNVAAGKGVYVVKVNNASAKVIL